MYALRLNNGPGMAWTTPRPAKNCSSVIHDVAVSVFAYAVHAFVTASRAEHVVSYCYSVVQEERKDDLSAAEDDGSRAPKRFKPVQFFIRFIRRVGDDDAEGDQGDDPRRNQRRARPVSIPDARRPRRLDRRRPHRRSARPSFLSSSSIAPPSR